MPATTTSSDLVGTANHAHSGLILAAVADPHCCPIVRRYNLVEHRVPTALDEPRLVRPIANKSQSGSLAALT
jgi:hypothetical protein